MCSLAGLVAMRLPLLLDAPNHSHTAVVAHHCIDHWCDLRPFGTLEQGWSVVGRTRGGLGM